MIALIKLAWAQFIDLFGSMYVNSFWFTSWLVFVEDLEYDSLEISIAVHVSQNALLSVSVSFSSLF